MFSRNTISLVLVGMIFLQSISFSSAQSMNNSDKEYDTQVQEDMQGVTGNEGFARIEKSVDKNLFDTTDAKLARKTAKDYIESLKPYDSHWKGNNPKLIGKPVAYYTDDTSTPISYEWKVGCSNTNDCGSVIVAVASNIARVMEAGTYGTANYERLGQGKESRKNKLYYYSAFDQYIESTSGNDITVDTLDPEKQIHKTSSERKDELKSRKDSVNSQRKSGKIHFEDIQKDIFTGLATSGTAVANIPGTNLGTCGGPLPCYNQFTSTSYAGANNAPCYSGCGPTALAIIFGYYDKTGKFPNLVGNSSILASDTSIDVNMVNSIRGYMGTQCSSTLSPDGTRGGETGFSSEGLGMQYARDRGYAGSTNGIYTAGSVVSMPIIMTEINAGRPVIVNYASTSGHIMAAYGYQTNPNMVHVNFGWAGAYPDKYLPVSLIAVTATQAGNGNPIIGMKFHSVVTVPIK